MKKTFLLIIVAVIIILIVIFTLQNSDQVFVKFFSYEFSSSLSLILFLTLVLGFIIAVLMLSPGRISDSKTIKRQNKRIITLVKEIEGYKKRERTNVEENKKTPEKGVEFENNLLANK